MQEQSWQEKLRTLLLFKYSAPKRVKVGGECIHGKSISNSATLCHHWANLTGKMGYKPRHARNAEDGFAL